MAKSGIVRDVNIISSDLMTPVDIQGVYAKTLQTHTAVSINANSWSTQTAWQDADGFSKISITAMSDASHSIRANIQWSNDGVNWHGEDVDIVNASRQRIAGSTQVKARYYKIALMNGDAGASHVMSAWVYLSAN